MPKNRKQLQIWTNGTVHSSRELDNGTRAKYFHYGYDHPVTKATFSRISDLSYGREYEVRLLSNRVVIVKNNI